MCNVWVTSWNGLCDSTTKQGRLQGDTELTPKKKHKFIPPHTPNCLFLQECDKSTWVHSVSNVYFKWCKGCKKFLRLGCFSEKLDAAKCDRCRERGRQSYLLKKGKDGTSRSRSNSITSMKSDFECDLSDNILCVAAAMASCGTRAAVSHSETSSGEEGQSGSDGEYDYPSRSLSPRERMGDYNDTLMSAQAVVSFANFHDRRNSESQESVEPVLIDDTTADVTKSKLSSVFGKPLRELKRLASPSQIVSDVADDFAGDELESDCGEPTAVCSQLRGTLYELACIHERIMTLEEHASRVKCLEATIKEQQLEIDALRNDASSLREELSRSKRAQSCEPISDSPRGKSPMDKNLAMILDDSVALEALTTAIERVQKRPRLVSMGE
jgi:hypothetical protein